MLRMSVWAVVLAACKSGTPDRDWSGVALDETVESTVNHARFTIRIPTGWKRDVDQEDMKGWRPDDVEDYHVEPAFTVGYFQQPPQSLDSYVESLSYAGTPIIDNKLATADYFEVVSRTEDNGEVRVDYVSHKGDLYVGCRAFQIRRGGVPNPRATLAWLARLCESLRIL